MFVFMARKAACFFDCLRELKIADVRGLAVSDRVLDMDLSFLKDKTVTLVDDCVFSGTTLDNARKKILLAGCKSCDTMTLSINDDWIRKELLPGGSEADELNFVTPLFPLDDSQCVQQCYDVVRAISIFPRPYDVDFPHTKTSKITDDDLDRLLHCAGWQAYDVSSEFQIKHGVRAFTLIPDRHILHSFMEGHAGCIDLVQAAKVRLYVRRLPGKSWSLRIVPIVMLGAVTHAQLEVGEALWGAELEGLAQELGILSSHSRYRFLHFLVAWAFLKQFAAVAQQQQKLSLTTELRLDLAGMVFGEKFPANAEKASSNLGAIRFPLAAVEKDASSTAGFGNESVTTDRPTELISACISPFTWLYTERELAARKIVKEHGLKACLEPEHKALSRLNNGFSPRRLRARLQSTSIDTSRYLSLFLDKAIDMGIAVPAVVEDADCVYRAFRHGEDAVYGESQERLTTIALEAYMTARGVKSLWGLELQKFVVLFIQIAVRDGLLERLNTLQSVNVGCRIVSIKGHLHGPVPMVTTLDESGTVGAPFVEGLDYPAEWLIHDWEQRGILKGQKEPHGLVFTLDKVPKIKIGIRQEAQAKKIGRCLGRLVGDQSATTKPPLNHNTDLVLLSTCAEAEHQMRALSGELSILVERWPSAIDRVRDAAKEGKYAEASELLLSVNDLFTAINSGAMKYRWFVESKFQTTVQEVRSAAEKIDPEGGLKDDWQVLWPDSLTPNATNTAPAIWKTITDMGQWLITANVAFRIYNYWLCLNAENAGERVPRPAIEVYSNCRKWAERYVKYCKEHMQTPFGKMVRSVLTRTEDREMHRVADYCRTASGFIDGAGRKAVRQLIEDASLLCEHYGSFGEIRPFPYAVFIDVEQLPDSKGDPYASQLRIASDLLDDETKLVEHNHNPWRTGLWILLRGGNRNSTKAVELCQKLVKRCLSTNVRFKAVVIGQLAYDDSVRDVAGSVKYSGGDFFRRISELKPHVLSAAYDNTVWLINENTTGAQPEWRKYEELSGQKSDSVSNVETKADDMPSKIFSVASVRLAIDPTAEWRADVGVLTVVATEARAVRSILKELVCDRKGPKTGRLFDFGSVLTAGGKCKVAHLQLREDGTMAAAVAYQKLLDECQPKLVVVVGIAGGISTDVDFCDVVIANKVIYYDRRKIQAGAENRSAGIGKIEARVIDLIQAYQRSEGEKPEYASKENSPTGKFKVQVAPMGCGEAVVAMKDSDVRKWLLTVDRKTLAVEMESSGVCHAFWDDTSSSEEKPLGVLVIRGISDHADKDKDDKYRIPASLHAAEVFRRILGHFASVA